jgi:hypothetical protein
MSDLENSYQELMTSSAEADSFSSPDFGHYLVLTKALDRLSMRFSERKQAACRYRAAPFCLCFFDESQNIFKGEIVRSGKQLSRTDDIVRGGGFIFFS